MRRLTAAAAREILATNTFPRQRKPTFAHTRMLLTTMEKGEFDGGAPIRFGRVGAKPAVLIDGQQRLSALSRMPADYSIEMPVVTSHCMTEVEVADIYSRIDRGRGRSMVDALRGLGVFDEKITGLTIAQAKTVYACSTLFEMHLRPIPISGSNYSSRSPKNRQVVMAPWLDAARSFYEAVANPNHGKYRLFMNRQVVCVGIATFGDPEAAAKATEFWQAIAADDGLKAHDPRKTCLEFIRNVILRGENRNGQGNNSKHTVSFLAYGVTACWNAYYQGLSNFTRIVTPPENKEALLIEGTRFADRDARMIPLFYQTHGGEWRGTLFDTPPENPAVIQLHKQRGRAAVL